MSSIDRAIASLGRVLAEVGWDAGREDAATWRVDLGPPHAPVSEVVLAIDAGAGSFVLVAHLAPDAPQGAREAVMRRMMRANVELVHGRFEMDPDEGAMRYRATVDFTGGELAEATIRHAILAAMQAVEAHAEALCALACGRAPIEALRPEDFFHG